ncbi:hypothetical protein L208DRAFT_503458 [Tricholoma matsutake]|nr:hypothetical protein L208DRAFT_503458 [Tricholoma matsutake 945]
MSRLCCCTQCFCPVGILTRPRSHEGAIPVYHNTHNVREVGIHRVRFGNTAKPAQTDFWSNLFPRSLTSSTSFVFALYHMHFFCV